MRIIFLGTPNFAVSVLENLINSNHEIVAVVTQPDKPTGRGQKLQFSVVKEFALNNNLKVLQYKKIKEPYAIEELKNLKADLMITAGYGQILSQEVLNITPLGVYNVHGSLLPKYRGASPVQTAIINGETITGVTIMKTDIGMDTGDIILQQEIVVLKDDTAGTMLEKMGKIGGKLLVEALKIIENGKLQSLLKKQDNELATKTKMIKKEDALIDFNKTPQEVANLVRGLNPEPIAYTYLEGKKLDVLKASVAEYNLDYSGYENGQVVLASPKQGLFVKASGGAVRLEEIKLEGKNRVNDKAFLNGKKILTGTRLGE
ncbi:MAG: methionyl-tRNA formyltransferase [Spirochaetales bacterium]